MNFRNFEFQIPAQQLQEENRAGGVQFGGRDMTYGRRGEAEQ